MKKIKLFALAVMAMLSTNIFAAVPVITSGAEQTIGGIKYTVKTVYKTPTTAKVNTVSAQMNSFSGTKITIPATVSFNCEGTGDSDGQPFVLENATFLVTEIEANGFKDLTNVTELEIGENVETIGANAFAGCKNLATVTLAAGSWLNTIGDGAFAYTSVEELNLSSATAYKADRTAANATGMTVFGSAGSDFGPFTSATYPTNIMISKVVLPTTCAKVDQGAFKACSEFSEIDLTRVKEIGASAFYGTALTAVAIGTAIPDATVGYAGIKIGANAFTACAKLATVEVGKLGADNATDINAAAFAGIAAIADTKWVAGDKVAAATVITDAVRTIFNQAGVELVGEGDPLAVTAAEATALGTTIDALVAAEAVRIPGTPAVPAAGVTTFKFNTISAAIGTTAWNLGTVRTIYFQKYLATANLVPAGAFTNAFPDKLAANTIYYNDIIVEGDAVLGINAAAFNASPTVERIIDLNTIEKVQTAYTSATAINKVTIGGDFSGSFIIGYGDDKKLAKDKNSNNYYYFVKAPAAKDLEIAKAQESGAKVTIYQAYTDQYKSAITLAQNDIVDIYVVPLKVSGGKYVVAAGEVVIIKSDKEDGVKATPITASVTGTMLSDADGILNELAVTAAAQSALDVKTGADFLNSGANDVWFFNNPTASGFGFTKYDQTKQKGLSKDCVYIQTALSTASARVSLIWLDDEGNTTAIQKVETKSADNGAIYNLRGEKVNASYKGLVIKNGKKFIQK